MLAGLNAFGSNRNLLSGTYYERKKIKTIQYKRRNVCWL